MVLVGFVAIFQNNQQENDELRQLSIRCEQQLGAMEAEKSRLENSIDSERLTREAMQQKLKEKEEKADESVKTLESLRQSQKWTDSQLADLQKENEKLTDDVKQLKEKYDLLQKEKEKEVALLKVSAPYDSDEDYLKLILHFILGKT